MLEKLFRESVLKLSVFLDRESEIEWSLSISILLYFKDINSID
jgi:hypothetical protein